MKKIVAGHIAVWALASSFFLIPLYLFGFTNRTLYAILCFLTYIIVFYVNTLWILPRWIKERQFQWLVLHWLLLILLCTVISLAFNHFLHVFTRRGNFKLELVNTFLRTLLFVTIIILAGVTYRSIIDWFRNEQQRQQLENEKLRTELDFLKAQTNPHFLFNTLNNIYALACQQSVKTAGAVMKLSEIMHFMIYESGNGLVPVAREIYYIDQLIELQELRTAGRLMLEFSVTGDTTGYSLAPLILMALVENIFKHGVLNDEKHPVFINLYINEGKLQFSAKNKINHAASGLPGGIGLANVRRRIELLYPQKHQFSITSDNVYYSVFLELQLI
ncbi:MULTISPECIES: sensor histidine kinase [Niastella]|uniref:Sensor histidine kinase n=1 Tax=Niastella soli TaxID=2821487 RepID=A0ABS3Z119_9BACT|nr:sensor histidine kinase [Niastella soli]MBO9203866.1 sensor histidine kinase [Niastella soli]